jgi:hypothetical protein
MPPYIMKFIAAGLSLPRTISALAVFFTATSVAVGQNAPAPAPAAPFPGVMNERLRSSHPGMSTWDIGANYRLRFEKKLGAGATDAGSNWDFSRRSLDDNNNSYWLSRLMPRVAYSGKDASFLVEGRASSSLGDERFNATAPGDGLPENDSGLDVHQAFVVIGSPKQSPLSLKLGRQELVYGEQRLVGHSRWGNIGRTFDAAKVRWQHPDFGVDVFTGGYVYNDSNNLNRSNPQDRFSGVYFDFPKVLKREIAEAYVFARNTARGIATDNWTGVAPPVRFPGAQDLYTAGVRIKAKPGAYAPFDYGAELMYQFGERAAVFPGTAVPLALAAPRLDHEASAAVLQGSYSWPGSPVQSRLMIIYSYGSGDRNASDTRSGTFQNLFPTNHSVYGYMDLSSLQNLHDVRISYAFKPTRTSTLAIEGHSQFLRRRTDFWYNGAGVPRNFATATAGSGGGFRVNPSYSNHLGNEVDVVATWALRRYAQLEAAACRYFRGDYIKQSLATVGSKDASYFTVQLTLNL